MPDIVSYVTPVPPRAAQGLVAQVYTQSRREIGRLVEAVTMFSPDPELLAASWAAFREPLLAQGRAPRAAKEAVAAMVSRLNDCPYCVDAHAIMLYGAGQGGLATQLLDGASPDGPYAPLAHWATQAGTAATAPPRHPFPEGQAAEYLGVLVYFHFLNRVINVLLAGTFLPGPPAARRIARRVAGKVMARTIAATNAPGQAAGLTPAVHPLPDDLAWAAGTPAVADAFATLAQVTAHGAGRALSPQARAVTAARIAQWHGQAPGLSTAWADAPLAELAPAERPAARLALLTALAPYQVTAADVAAYQAGHPGDQQLLALLAWSAFTAARRVGAWTTHATTSGGAAASGSAGGGKDSNR